MSQTPGVPVVQTKAGRFVYTNLNTYLSIAEEALAESQRLLASGRRPRPDGKPGWSITLDPDHRSFKHSLIAIAFSGMYLEALFYHVGVKRFGLKEYDRKIDRLCYEQKLKKLGLSDPKMLETCQRFREARKDLVHEKAFARTKLMTAQVEAEVAVTFVKSVAQALGVPLPKKTVAR